MLAVKHSKQMMSPTSTRVAYIPYIISVDKPFSPYRIEMRITVIYTTSLETEYNIHRCEVTLFFLKVFYTVLYNFATFDWVVSVYIHFIPIKFTKLEMSDYVVHSADFCILHFFGCNLRK